MGKRLERPSLIGLDKIWGGDRLSPLKGHKLQMTPDSLLGEVIEVSTLPGLETLNLDQKLPYLFKLIDTSQPLSVQVHPDDEYAKKYESSSGKSECWYVLNAQDDSLIYLGFKPGVEIEQIDQTMREQGDLSSLMNSYRPQVGDFFTVPAGTVHAIGAGITLAEVQQPSGITYRFWDWGRVGADGKPRELHVQQAFDVLKLDDESQVLPAACSRSQVETLWQGPGFTVKKILLTGEDEHKLEVKKKSTLFALCDFNISTQDEFEDLSLWQSLFFHEGLSLLASAKDKEVQCLIIEPS